MFGWNNPKPRPPRHITIHVVYLKYLMLYLDLCIIVCIKKFDITVAQKLDINKTFSITSLRVLGNLNINIRTGRI